jgi:hypothetical protein
MNRAITDQRARLLRTAVAFALIPPTEPELRVLHQWLNCWRGAVTANRYRPRNAHDADAGGRHRGFA